MRQRARRTILQNERGSAFVEFAFAAPVLFAVIYGGVEMARAMSSYNAADQSMRLAVRYLSRIPSPDTKTWAVANAKNLAKFGTIASGTTNLMPGATINDPQVTTPVAGGPSIVSMKADVPFSSTLLSAFGVPSITFHIYHEERIIAQ